jgi:hypothetical protein
MAKLRSKLRRLREKQSLIEIYFGEERVCRMRHLTGGQALGFVKSGKFASDTVAAEFFRSRNIPIPRWDDRRLTVKVLSKDEEAVVIAPDPQPAKSISKTAQAKAAAREKKFALQRAQLPLLQLHPAQGTGYEQG